ncbi:homoprotocatechuate degradation operon regulator HpaR [Maritimibacter dapengensis]|uniref:Homoprotocatechuate degradation operon regulator HpaR n=1 Tax=Maritimibacter dapengensis TaxID=2836868 RepID=A0ABS6T224_9RHOB|nr:homoprotocatechuate degradation operon regulator HpaR [Maritimibacter dapengensis]MBV7378422.1 homoprotocatechuate degradation operon regulator HpaR [Maritimibacter dapengensis]
MSSIEKKPITALSRTRRTLPMALLRARETVMDRFRPMLHRHGVTEQQWRVLRVLDEADSIDASELAEGAAILAPSLSRILKTLETRGFIELRKDPGDGRRSLISLTRAGSAFLAEVAPESAEIYKEIEGLIGAQRIETLLDEIDTLIVSLSEKR